MKKILNLIINLVIFGLGMYLILVNQRTVGMSNLLKMLLGLGLLFSLIYMYNKKFT